MIRSQPRNLCRATELYLELPTPCLYLPATRAFLSPEVQNCSHYFSSKTCCSSCILYPRNRICLWGGPVWRPCLLLLFSLTCSTLCFIHNKLLIVSLLSYSVSVLVLCSCFSLYLEYLPTPCDKHILIFQDSTQKQINK